jgi:nitrite reductase/ring-hydroxylating ferredoxin subunit
MNGIKRSVLKLFFLLLLILSIAPACKDDFDSAIPYVNVNYSVNLVNYNALNTVGFPVFFNGAGYGGIVVINNGVSFYAYDVTCPYEIDFQCRIEADGVIGTCPCCNTQYNLLDGGYVISGPSAEPLKQYRASLSANRLYITN